MVGGSPVRDFDEVDHPRRELVFQEEDLVDEFAEDMFNEEDVIIEELTEEDTAAVKEIVEDTREYVSLTFVFVFVVYYRDCILTRYLTHKCQTSHTIG